VKNKTKERPKFHQKGKYSRALSNENDKSEKKVYQNL
jgi:hypothetical protein